MDLAARQSFLARLPHFRALSRELVERIAANTAERTLEAEQALFGEGEPARAFFAVVEGRIRVYRVAADGHEQVLHHLHAGQSFAEAALLSMGRYPAHARALTPTRVLEIGGQTFVAMLRDEPGVSVAMVSSLCMWLLKLAERVEELSIASAPARLAHYLLRLPTRSASGQAEIELPMAKKDLAAHLAITPETLSRLLRRWHDTGVIESRAKSVVVLEPRVLIGIADQIEE
jgi:CRP-like cAMP-binding protein